MKSDRHKKLKQAILYAKEQISNGNYPSYKKLQKKFNIKHHNIKLWDIYEKLGVTLLATKTKRPNSCGNALEKELIEYLREEVNNGHYPTRRYIENRFNLRLTTVLDSIKELYDKAGIEYKQANSQELKNKKAKMLTEIVLSFLPKLNIQVIEVRGVHEKGVDILAKDNGGKNIGIEIKAHNKFEPIKERNFSQLKRFLQNERLDKVILVTSTSKFEKHDKTPNLEIIDYPRLLTLCDQTHVDDIEFIRNETVHVESDERLNKKRIIVDYVKNAVKIGKKISYDRILKDTHLDAYTYFNKINDIYIEAGILPPINKIGGKRGRKDEYYELVLEQILQYMKNEIKRGYYPTGKDIGNRFGISHIWNFITMTELYEKLDVSPYHKRKSRFKVAVPA